MNNRRVYDTITGNFKYKKGDLVLYHNRKHRILRVIQSNNSEVILYEIESVEGVMISSSFLVNEKRLTSVLDILKKIDKKVSNV